MTYQEVFFAHGIQQINQATHYKLCKLQRIRSHFYIIYLLYIGIADIIYLNDLFYTYDVILNIGINFLLVSNRQKSS